MKFGAPRERVSLDIPAASIFRAVLILLGVWFLYLIWDVLLMLFAAVVVASAIGPVANWLERYRVPRAGAVVLVYVVLILALSGVVTLMIEPLVEQVRQLAQAVPSIVAYIEQFVVFTPGVERTEIINTLQQSLLRFGDSLRNVSLNLFQGAGTFVSGVVMVLFVFALAFYLVVERDALKKFARLVTPHAHLAYVERSIERAQRGVGRWMLAQLALGIIIGLIVGVGLWLIGVPYALLLGILAGVMEIVPVIGPIVAAIPGVLVGLTQSLLMGAIALGFYILTQQFENHVLVPNIMRRAVGLHPLVTILAVLLGARLAGVAGAILAVPLATVLSIFLSDIFAAPKIEDELAG